MDIETGISFVFKGLGLVLIVLVVVFFVSFLISIFYRAIKASKKNNNEQVQIDHALVVSKRSHHIKVTTYYITFQFSNGERKEFWVSANDYGLIAENDKGKLKFQGTRFISFVRE